MSSWLRSREQELCRENKKNSLTASLSRIKSLFHAAGYNYSSCALPSDHSFKYVMSSDQNEAAKAINICLMSHRVDIFREGFRNDVFSVYWAHNFVLFYFILFCRSVVGLYHKSPDCHNWQHHGGPMKNCPNSHITKRYLLSCRINCWKMKDS